MKHILFVVLISAVSFSACKKKSEEIVPVATPESTTVEKVNRAFFANFSETWCGVCGSKAGPAFDSCLTIEGSIINLMKVYKSSTPNSLNSSISAGMRSDYGVPGTPSFWVNETVLSGGVYTTISSNYNWVKSKADLFASTPVIAGAVLYGKSISGTTLSINTKVQFFDAQTAGQDYRLALYVVESDIIANQTISGGHDSNYKHNNLLRACNAVDYKGDKINNDAAVANNQVFEKSYSIALESGWNTSNLKVIGVIWKVPTSGKATVVNSTVKK